MDLGLKGRKALVTGGAVGIGRAIALDLAREGVQVAITSRKAERLDRTLTLMGGREAGHCAVVCDVSAEGGPQALARDLRENFGRPDVVVNNVGGTLDITDPYCPISDWRRVFRVNFEVAVEITNLFLPHMKEQDWGRIVTITSGAGLENSGPVTYCASKAALTAYVRTMGRILATETSNVVMTAVMPGAVFTEEGHWDRGLRERPEHVERYLRERCPLGRLGQPSEISAMAVFLCSEKASFCQGAIVPVDAGQARHYMYFNFLS